MSTFSKAFAAFCGFRGYDETKRVASELCPGIRAAGHLVDGSKQQMNVKGLITEAYNKTPNKETLLRVIELLNEIKPATIRHSFWELIHPGNVPETSQH